ncbi:MAG: hypothetical protein GC191_16620 [Azospirillum sp.]|nr:hypothetical protein [Azospirillum sp.]
MTEDPKISHIANRLKERRESDSPDQALIERVADAVDMRLAKHFQSQNELLMASIGRLIEELDGVRSGAAEHAFDKIASSDCPADISTVRVDPALIYKFTAEEIGKTLGLTATQVGTLLGSRGLNWADDPVYQEVDRFRPGRQRF